MYAHNAEYNPKRFAACILRFREPKTTALVFATGKMVCTGAKSVENARTATRKVFLPQAHSHCLSSLRACRSKSIQLVFVIGITMSSACAVREDDTEVRVPGEVHGVSDIEHGGKS